MEDDVGVYEELGVKRLINAWGPITKIGGSLMAPEVLAAMAEAGRSYVDLEELQRRAGERIARLIGVEGCYITTGCAAGVTIATAALLTGDDPGKIWRLPETTGMRNEVVVKRSHRNGYDHAVRQVGVKLVEIGGGRSTERWELEQAIGPNTAAVFHTYAIWTRELPLTLPEVVEVAHARNVPVIVDAAAEVPPLRNLKGLSATGADVVVFSGGKGLRGPQTTGLVLAPPEIIKNCALNASPNHSIGRPMKVGKEEIVGMVRAIELYLSQDQDAVYAQWLADLATIERALANLPGVTSTREEAFYSEGIPSVRIAIDPSKAGISAAQLESELAAGDPGVKLVLERNALVVNPHFLEKGEANVIAERMRRFLRVPVAAR